MGREPDFCKRALKELTWTIREIPFWRGWRQSRTFCTKMSEVSQEFQDNQAEDQKANKKPVDKREHVRDGRGTSLVLLTVVAVVRGLLFSGGRRCVVRWLPSHLTPK